MTLTSATFQRIAVDGGHLAVWVDGAGPRVLLLHGGPGLSAEYLDELVDELVPGYLVALYQQRGLAPSTEDGPFTIAQAVTDAVAVLDGLHWDKTFVVGHSWGGHLALHIAAAAPDRVLGVLSIDPMGGVGDGGSAAFEAEMLARTPEADRQRAKELDERAFRGEGTPEDVVESLALVWPAYFADPTKAPPPTKQISLAAYVGGFESMMSELPRLESSLSSITVQVGLLAGGASPMPVDLASHATAERLPNAWVEVVPDAGHFVWIEAPGSVRRALDRLTGST
jgi:pimeloyl-ACP methyl ester carboxylesterase